MTDKILIDRELLESTLQCLTNLWSSDEYIDGIKEKLRAAIVAPQQEAVAWMLTNKQSGDVEVAWDTEGFPIELWQRKPLYAHPAPSVPEGELTLPEQLRNRPNPEWYRKKIAESGDGEPHCIGSAAPKVLSSPDQNCITQKVPDVWQLIEECRSSVKFDLNRYERMALDFKRLGAEGKRTYDMADAEATRLHALLEKIDAAMAAQPS